MLQAHQEMPMGVRNFGDVNLLCWSGYLVCQFLLDFFQTCIRLNHHHGYLCFLIWHPGPMIFYQSYGPLHLQFLYNGMRILSRNSCQILLNRCRCNPHHGLFCSVFYHASQCDFYMRYGPGLYTQNFCTLVSESRDCNMQMQVCTRG